VTYKANSKAWMRSDIFIEWLNDLDYYFHTLDKKILLLIDNAGSHFNPKKFEEINEESENDSDNDQESSQSSNKKQQQKKKKENIKITNIKLVYFPQNTTLNFQPMVAGIINSFKTK